MSTQIAQSCIVCTERELHVLAPWLVSNEGMMICGSLYKQSGAQTNHKSMHMSLLAYLCKCLTWKVVPSLAGQPLLTGARD